MFVIWGTLHGIAIVIHRIWKQLGFSMNKFLAWFITFNFINITWVFFRANDIDSAMKILSGMFKINNIYFNINIIECFILVIVLSIVLFFKNSSYYIKKFDFNIQMILISSIFFSVSILIIRLRHASEFLYFNF